MSFNTTTACGVLFATCLAAAGAQAQPATSPSPEPSPSPSPASLRVGAFVDAYYAYNSNHPFDNTNFFPGVGTSAKRADEISINLAQVDLTLDPQPVGFRLALGFGTATEVVHAAEPPGPFVGSDVWEHVVQASAMWKATDRLLFEAGVYPSHIGFEGFASKDNWNYTRSWLGELSPYYQTGLKTAYTFSDHWSAQLHVLNGWQIIGENNSGKAFGTQVAYSSDRLSASFNTFVGPELPDNDDDYRLMGDFVLTVKATPSLSLGTSLDLAREERPVGDDARWWGTGLYARYAPPDSKTAFAVRGEYYDDEDGAISGTPQTLKEFTATLEHRPVSNLILKLEGRYDKSSADVFAGEDNGLDRPEDGPTFHKDSQFLVLVGVVASF
jgi:Putative beta-barrel porin-2, OmpL-like. bbp2